MKIYISAKMNGCLDYRDKFNEAENKLREIGCDTVNPCTISDILIQTFSYFNKKPEVSVFMRDDIIKLCDCDGILMLDNWTDSEGAIWEFLIAKKVLGIPVFFSIESLKEELLKRTV